jgi:hypothetical protein
MQIRFKAIFLILLLIAVTSYAQNRKSQIDSLLIYTQLLTSQSPDFRKYEANEKFKSFLETLFCSEDSYSFPFDSVKTLSAINAPDNKFKIITWGIAKENGTYEYFGYILFPNTKQYPKKFICLTDKTDKIILPESQISDFTNWFGAIYYKMVLTRNQGKKYYTLLGWKGNSALTTKKVIDVLSFRSSGIPVFGAMLFRKYKEKSARVVFEYSSQTTMLLRYEKQFIHVITKPAHSRKSKYNPKYQNNSKALKADKKVQAKQKTVKTSMILFDRLSPIDPRTSKYSSNLEGQYQFYAPETNILDAFIFSNGKWVFTKDIDARNPVQKKKKAKKIQGSR